MLFDVFRRVREGVTAENAARYYGMTLDSRGRALCPFHTDHHPSMTFKHGHFRCWSCGASGSSVDLVAHILGLTPLDAVKRLNVDFALGLDLNHREPTPRERQEIARRRMVGDTRRDFEEWRRQMINKLNAAFRVAQNVDKHIEALTDAEALAVREQSRIEYLSDVLSFGTLDEQVSIFRERKEVEQLCTMVLSNTPPKYAAG